MTRLLLKSLRGVAIQRLDMSLDGGQHLLLGTEGDGTAELVALLAGHQRPRKGSIELSGTAPYRSPALRRRIGSLLNQESLVPAPNTRSALNMLGQAAAAISELEAMGLSSVINGPVETLSPAALRAVVLARALTLPDPVGLFLYEPFQTALPSDWVVARLAAARARSIVTVIASSNVELASWIDGSLMVMEQGAVVARYADSTEYREAVGQAVLMVRSPQSRWLAHALTTADGVSAVQWDHVAAPNQLIISGANAEQLVSELLRVSRAPEVQLESYRLLHRPGEQPYSVAMTATGVSP